jgi:hypothetical protein
VGPPVAWLLTLEDAPNVTGRKPELVETGMPGRANVVNDPARDQRRAGSFVRCSPRRCYCTMTVAPIWTRL